MYCLRVVDVRLIRVVFQPGGSWSSSGSSSSYAPNFQVKCDATFPYLVTMESQSYLKYFFKEGGVGFALAMLLTPRRW